MHSLAPTLLVAAPSLACPMFGRSVVLLAQHDEDGAFGLIINRESNLTLSHLLEEMDLSPEEDVKGVVQLGGPVSTDSGWVVFRINEEPLPANTMIVSDELAITSSNATLRAIAEGRGPEDYSFFVGYAGWGPGQLEEELTERSWIPLEVNADLVFSNQEEETWKQAVAKMGFLPAMWTESSREMN